MQFWRKLGLQEIEDSINLKKSINTNVAKNIILFIGDGMGITSTTAARIFKAQQENKPFPEREYLAFERLPNLAHSKVSKFMNNQHNSFILKQFFSKKRVLILSMYNENVISVLPPFRKY